MSLKPIFISEKAEICLDEDQKIIRANWKGFLNIHDVREGMKHLLEGAHTYGIQRHISDQTELRMLEEEIQIYLVKDGLVGMEGAGLNRVGIIQSKDYFAQIAVHMVNRKARVKDLAIQAFSGEKDCVEWLISS